MKNLRIIPLALWAFFLHSPAVAEETAASAMSVSNVTIGSEQTDGFQLVTVTYALGEAPAIITVDFLTNGVSIGEKNFNNVVGAVNRLITQTGEVHKICWRPAKSWAGNGAEAVSAKVTAWSPDDPPAYMVVSLEEGYSVPPVSYYVSTNAFPGGLSDDIYRTSRLVMRRIKAAGVKWQMGATKADYLQAGWSETAYEGIAEGDKPREVPHSVMLTYDYFIGIYPVTQEQYRRFTKASALGGYFTGYADSALRPRCGINYNGIRGSGTTTEHSSVTAGSAIGKLRAYTGIDFDLPSDAEWEYACRAGTTTLLYSGASYAGANLYKLGWAYGNSSYPAPVSARETHAVGQKLPNAWGVYDLYGNTVEWCRDKFVSNLGTNDVVNPVVTTGTERVLRGSRYDRTWDYAHSAYRGSDVPNRSAEQAKAYGFRLMCPVTLKFGK